MYLLVILLPFINFLILSFFGRFIGKNGTIIVTIVIYIFSIILIILVFNEVIFLKSICYFKIFNWILINEFNLYFGLLFDEITVIMLFVVFFISSLVHIYSFGYMDEDPHFIRFISFLSLFTFFMVIIITSDNFIQLFFGWECVGLASYLLINFWYTRLQANKSGLKAIIVNKIGDLTIMIAIITLFYCSKSFDYLFIFNYINYINNDLLIFINLMLLIGIIAKSAQLGLHTWLVDAMEGPTPVSALLHAATMVTVGIFCLIRFNFLFNQTPFVLFIISIIGALTALFGSIVGLAQNDIKRVIAYSTCSQLGYMALICGFSYYELALYHLTNHAFFKALLFLTAGGVIHALNGKQDIREMGSLLNIQPILYMCFSIGSIALMGLPFLAGYYSKDFILEFIYVNNENTHFLFIYLLGLIGAFFTAFYSLKLIYLTFISNIKNINKIKFFNIHKLSIFIYLPLILLCCFSIVIGWIFKDLFIGLGSSVFNVNHNLYFLLINTNLENTKFYIKFLPNFVSILAICGSIFYCINHKCQHKKLIKILSIGNFINYNNFFQKKLFFDFIYYIFFTKISFILSYNFFYKIVDRGLYEILGPQGVTTKLYNFAFAINFAHKTYFYYFIIYFLLNVIILLFIIFSFLFDFINIEETIILYIINIFILLFFFK